LVFKLPALLKIPCGGALKSPAGGGLLTGGSGVGAGEDVVEFPPPQAVIKNNKQVNKPESRNKRDYLVGLHSIVVNRAARLLPAGILLVNQSMLVILAILNREMTLATSRYTTGP
tara:strand:- start:1028 stop:1372 length:345 start_codon:yes stop_codon:yes gene_type:complete